jgi:hypothetical protein
MSFLIKEMVFCLGKGISLDGIKKVPLVGVSAYARKPKNPRFCEVSL